MQAQIDEDQYQYIDPQLHCVRVDDTGEEDAEITTQGEPEIPDLVAGDSSGSSKASLESIAGHRDSVGLN